MDRSTESYCMIVAVCAYVMIQANHKPLISVLPRPEMAHMSNVSVGHILLEESVRVRQSYDHRENPTHTSVLTSWFYSGCYFGLARENTAWTYLREATTHAQLLGMHDEETYKHDSLDVSRKRVLYWLLFISERYVQMSSEFFCICPHFANDLPEPTLYTNTDLSHYTPPYIFLNYMKYSRTGQLRLDWGS